MARVFIGVGSNQGDRLGEISQAVRALGAARGVRVTQMATVIETEPVGGVPQEPYLNTVVELETSVSPRPLLELLKRVEQAQGRAATGPRNAPRPIDLDLLLYGEQVIQEPDLQVPHPRMHERRFVLEPLAQLAPDATHPMLQATVSALLAQLAQPAGGGTRAVNPSDPPDR